MKTEDTAALIIKFEEESNIFKPKPYYDHLGYPTIGWGFRIPGTSRHDPLPPVVMTENDGNIKLHEYIENNIKSLTGNEDTKKAFELANDARKAIMLSMVYQVGMYGLLKFKKFLAAASVGDYERAAKEMLNSLAARQTPERWKRQAKVMRTGTIDGVY